MNPLIQQFVKDYISNPDPYSPMQKELMQETQEWGVKQDAANAGHKAHRIYVKALVRKKIPLAQRIKNKYGDLFPRPTDSDIALGFALMATSKTK